MLYNGYIVSARCQTINSINKQRQINFQILSIFEHQSLKLLAELHRLTNSYEN